MMAYCKYFSIVNARHVACWIANLGLLPDQFLYRPPVLRGAQLVILPELDLERFTTFEIRGCRYTTESQVRKRIPNVMMFDTKAVEIVPQGHAGRYEVNRGDLSINKGIGTTHWSDQELDDVDDDDFDTDDWPDELSEEY